jgi:hypothetical protein
LLSFISAFIEKGSVLAAWKHADFSLSLSSAYRWLKAFRSQIPHLRSTLCRISRPPPEHTSMNAESLTLQMFTEVFHDKNTGSINELASFQSHFQVALF